MDRVILPVIWDPDVDGCTFVEGAGHVEPCLPVKVDHVAYCPTVWGRRICFDCGKKHHARGYCRKCYLRHRRERTDP